MTSVRIVSVNALAPAILLLACTSKSDEQRAGEIAASGGIADLKIKTEGGRVRIAEARISHAPSLPIPDTAETRRQARVHQAYFECIRPRAKREGIEIDYPFTMIVD